MCMSTVQFVLVDKDIALLCTFHVAGFSRVRHRRHARDNVFFWSYVGLWLLSNALFIE